MTEYYEVYYNGAAENTIHYNRQAALRIFEDRDDALKVVYVSNVIIKEREIDG